MKLSDSIATAFYNIIRLRRTYLKVFITFLFVFTLLTASVAYGISVEKQNDEAAYGSLAINYAKNDTAINLSPEEREEIRASDDNIAEVRKIADFAVGGIYIGIEGGVSDFLINSSRTRIVEPSCSSLPYNSERELFFRYGEKPIKYGRDIIDENDVLISESLLRDMNVSDLEGCLNKTLKIFVSGGGVSGDYKIAGILTANIDRLTSIYGYNESIIIKKDISLYGFFKEYRVYFKDVLKSYESIKSLSERYGDYEFKPFRVTSNVWNTAADLNSQKLFYTKFLSLICIIFTAAMLINTVNDQIFLNKRRTEYFGVLKTQGASNRNIFWIIMLETLMICLASVLLACLISSGLMLLINKIYLIYYKISVLAAFSYYIKIFLFDIAFAVLLSVLIAFIVVRKAVKHSLADLLRNGE
ncbi:MAG: FtsX-like permease family protein [Clostridiales bacterium]|jgi:ABC-type antimicrobial peptide transport system permease subunit|nr:FtsX-like permease family protein [Clostridiales bacterium]